MKFLPNGSKIACKSHSDSAAYLAMTFAGKEAIFKCFGIGWETGVKLREIEIRDGDFGEPDPILSGKFAGLASERGVAKALLSLSYDTEYAVGTANLIGSEEPRPIGILFIRKRYRKIAGCF